MSLPRAALPIVEPTAPKAPLPEGACDAHVHMMGDDFPLWDGRVEDPAPGLLEDWAQRLERHLARLGLARVVIVHSIVYGGDNAVTLAAVRRLGGRARGIGLVTDGATEAELDALAEAGVRGVRLNYVHGGILSWAGVQAMAPRLAARGMHVQMLMNAHRHMADLADAVRGMPVPVVFDHIGWPNLGAGPSEPGFDQLRGLVADGAALVKLSGLYRLCDAPYDAAAEHVASLATANPDGCLWGSDWPHIMLADAKQPDAGILLNAFLDVVTRDADRRTILTQVPERLYGF
ncbi:2-pyrone-4,6-dicarboxylate hydrolase [Jannaschia pagri]|uniref:2-pyrone-4,6-dicarboxylate hydrolase n=1 Tax=Jannaschia pagri TaxID=2829797 RepID=A0ABQ4NJ22_9RHOB|nr:MULTISPECIES: amidohydrolase family protein [unclassified Jannaschia]GIT90581.1 2-pyrone-4,6-dicarboxylate hydrolase [Jannaschia sp. AI_61]GIT94413.1 2-pyrone-4,6-dicarboxylate hydrolase [Jannaschia sp. AI_62]